MESVSFQKEGEALMKQLKKYKVRAEKARKKQKGQLTPCSATAAEADLVADGTACVPFEDILTHTIVLLVDFLRYALVTR